MITQKNISSLLTCKTALFFCVLFFSVAAKAQKEETMSDTLITTDTTVNEVMTAPADEEDTNDKSSEEKKNNFFLKKWEYGNDSFSLQQRKVPDEVKKKMQEDDDFWYANKVFEKEKEKIKENNDKTSFFDSDLFQTILWIVIIVAFAAFLIWFLRGSNVGLFRKKDKAIHETGEELDTQDIFAINYQQEIDKAAQAGNYRLAIRLMFLRLLKNMSEKNVIQYKQEKTNLDYLMQLHNTNYYPVFFRITRNYEYCWYGLFDVSAASYNVIKNDFDNLDSQLK
jgi:hypothetical protein